MFDCKSTTYSGSSCLECIRNIVRDGGQSFGLPLETDRTTFLLGVEVHQFYEPLVHELSKIARERIQKLNIFNIQTCSIVKGHREEITRFLRLVLGSANIMRGKLSYQSISTILHVVPHLVDPLKKYGWNSAWDKNFGGYEVYHGVLEWRWLLMLVLKEEKDYATNIDMINEFFEMQPMKTFDTIYRDLMVDMLDLAYHQFRLHSIENIATKSSYACSCVKHMWLGLMVLADTEKLDFWNCLSESMPSILKEKEDAYLFKIWQINALAKLYEEKQKLADDAPLVTLPNGCTIIDDILKDFLKSDSTEQKARIFLILLKPIVTVLWPARIETVIALWSYFSVRLNSSFRTNSDPLDTIGCVSPSVHGFIEQATTLAALESMDDTLDLQRNSFQMFLKLLSWIIHHYTAQSLKKKVQIVFNRIFLKMGPSKYENMTEQAIYNLGLMFLTMISATTFDCDYSRISNLIQLVPLTDDAMKLPLDSTIKRIAVTARAHMAILVLFSSSSFDKTTHIVTLLDSLELAYRKYGNRLLPVMEMIADGTCLIFKKAIMQASFNRGEISLLRPWMLKYLRHTSIDRWQKLLDGLSDTLSCKSWSLSEEYFSAINQHVMPFVKEKFLSKVASPPCIARIAARMTIHSASGNSKNDQISSSFNNYVDCPVACPDQILVYLKEVTQSSEALTSIDHKVIIRQWLKMGILHDNDSLLDLTRVVYGLDDFKALCEIPEYDMFDSNTSPMKLFFRFVGTRYHELDSSARMMMKNELYIIFEDFDKWFPDPKGIIRQRILAVLVLALKGCPQAFYINSNLRCLYSIAFQHFFLPLSVLVDGNVQLDFIEDIATIWHQVMDALGNMNYKHDQIIGDNAYNMMNKWVPQFAKFPNAYHTLRPLMLFFCARNEDLVLFVMPRFVMAYVDLKRCLPKPNALEVMQILKNLIKSLVKQKDYGKVVLFIRTTGLSLTQHAFMCNETYHTREIAMEMLFDLLTSTDEPSNLIKIEMRNVLIAFTLKYFPVSAECYLNFMCRIVNRYPNFIRSMIVFIRRDGNESEITCAQEMDGVLCKASYMLESKLDARLKPTNSGTK